MLLNLTYTPSHRKVFDTTGNIKIIWKLQKSVDASKVQYRLFSPCILNMCINTVLSHNIIFIIMATILYRNRSYITLINQSLDYDQYIHWLTELISHKEENMQPNRVMRYYSDLSGAMTLYVYMFSSIVAIVTTMYTGPYKYSVYIFTQQCWIF